MGNQVVELPSILSIKVHRRMCSELLKLVRSISTIFPELEDARPRCSSGIGALCMLNETTLEAKTLLQRCCDHSVLYLALTGDALLSRCSKYRNLFDQSLSQIKTMVPVVLVAKISGIIADLRTAEFHLDPAEAEAGKVLQELLRRSNSPNGFDKDAAIAAIRNCSSLLGIVSQKALLIEKRSIKKMIDSFGERERERGKRVILIFFLDLLKKYGKGMVSAANVNGSSDLEHHLPVASPYRLSKEVEFRIDCMSGEAEIGMLSRHVPPEEFLCYFSSKLMFDPVIIASGETYERMWIEKWFEDGNGTCPKTKKKLPNLSLTSNTGMKLLITKWCSEHGISVLDPRKTLVNNMWETCSNSIASITSSLYNLNLPVDYSNVSLGSCPESDLSNTEMTTLQEDDDMKLLSKLSESPWDSRCNTVEDIKKLLKQGNGNGNGNGSAFNIPPKKFAHSLLRFLRDAYNLCDTAAQISGCELLLEFLQNDRDGISYIKKDAYNLLALFLDTDEHELVKHALLALKVLSSHRKCGKNIASSGALSAILNILDSKIPGHLELALHVLSNLSSNLDISSSIVSSDVVSKLVPLSEEQELAGHCMAVLRNACDNESGRLAITETQGCIASIVKVLEMDDHKTQEDALSILLPLCSQRTQYCHLIMDEGIFSNLLSVSVNGNNGAKAAALELLRILRDVIEAVEANNADPDASWSHENSPSPPPVPSAPKAQGLLGRVFGKKKKKT
ncbi:U-box domain-containing protein 5-like isoform X2 [Andrographis paniculata]|uniref:U-box domain-containing protein 5-like isoform X2 n=1 Tax=Andrographis paniculata TaxID=175694 RepID=UPI0021E7610E|nr:U-box domain-containing protein 5-like isoform X2 [Andrographis paniculata]